MKHVHIELIFRRKLHHVALVSLLESVDEKSYFRINFRFFKVKNDVAEAVGRITIVSGELVELIVGEVAGMRVWIQLKR